MFHRRRTPSVGRGNPNPSASAMTAASQAFLAHQSSSASLSSAAAAQALRSHTASPTPVGDIQTRRMLQRQASNSSNGSAARPPSRGGAPALKRQGSSGSMTERTFRDPSPSRPVSRGAVDQPPPVPKVPVTYNQQDFPPPGKTHRRAISMEPLPRVVSPPPNASGGRGVSLDRRPGQPPGRPPSNLENIAELERTNSRNSINFSYPTHARPNSPTPPASPISPTFAQRPIPCSPPTKIVPEKQRQPITPVEASNVQQSVANAANKPVKKKKKKVVTRDMAEGSHLSSGTTGVRPTGTAVNASPAQIKAMTSPLPPANEPVAMPPQPAEQPKKPKKKKAKPKVDQPSQQDYQPSLARQGSDSESASEAQPQTRRQLPRASGQLQKQPSIVREDWEGEEAAEMISHHRKGAPTLIAAPVDARVVERPPPPRPNQSATLIAAPADVRILSEEPPPKNASNVAPRTKKSRPAAANTSMQSAEAPPQATAPALPPPALVTTQASPTLPEEDKQLTTPKQNGSIQVARPQSLSPSRKTHFANRLSVDDTGERKHQPPPRSVSPAKSAMKHHSPSPQALSPVDAMPGSWRVPGAPSSEASDSMISDEGSRPPNGKKKRVRVSFDDEPVVVGTATREQPNAIDSPVVEELPIKAESRRSWFGSGKGKAVETLNDDDENGIKPMPALPSFGSIRQKRPTQDASYSTPLSSGSNSSTSSVSNQATLDTQISSDHAIGGILSQDFASRGILKSTAPVMTNEPLPPEVTSVEGSGYASDTDDGTSVTDGSIYSEDPPLEETQPPLVFTNDRPTYIEATPSHEVVAKIPEPIPEAPTHQMADQERVPQRRDLEDIPEITIDPATPGSEHGDKLDGVMVMPGGFPISTKSLNHAPITEEKIAVSPPTLVSPATAGIAEPVPSEVTALENVHTPPADESTQLVLPSPVDEEEEDESDESGNSIYSDAAEDASDFEGDGFGSINAIVESPIIHSPSLPASSPPDSPAQFTNNGKSRDLAEPVSQKGWDKTQEHWSNINQSRKDNQQVAASATPAAQKPIELSTPKPKPKKKKTVPVNADKPLLAPTVAARNAATNSNGPKPSLKQQGQPSKRRSMRSVPEPEQRGQPTMRRSMRSAPEHEPEDEPTHLRQSMRSSGLTKSSMRGNQSGPTHRHSLTGVPPTQPKGTLQKKNIRPMSDVPQYSNGVQAKISTGYSLPPGPAMVPAKGGPAKPKKAGTAAPLLRNDSDSSSSFQKARPKKPDGEGYTMRRSMRSVSADPRPQSPVMERYPRIRDTNAGRPQSSSGGMRSTMRSSIDSGKGPTLRSNRPSSPTNFSFGIGKSKDKPAKPAAGKSASRFSSRFDDSSDEEAGPRRFRSRFVDSSDDEDTFEAPKNLRPVRGIPRKHDEGDSTDLEDSSEDEGARASKTTKETSVSIPTKPAASKEGTALQSGSLRRSGSGRDLSKRDDLDTEQAKKKSFFGRFRSKKDKSKVQKLDAESAARIDAGLARPPPERTTSSPKLQRRMTPTRFGSESWPLPDTIDAGDKGRPSTSDGVPGRVRTNTESTTATDPGATFGRAAGKKKRFPMLRKAFGLND